MDKRGAEVPMETSDEAAIMLPAESEISDLRGSKWVWERVETKRCSSAKVWTKISRGIYYKDYHKTYPTCVKDDESQASDD